jgi:hypothetical protein
MMKVKMAPGDEGEGLTIPTGWTQALALELSGSSLNGHQG